MSRLKYFDYNIRNFDWVLITDVETRPAYRGHGLATALINRAYREISDSNPKKGMYLLVKTENTDAVELYQELDFKIIKRYALKNENYFVMAKGGSNVDQLLNMDFS